MGFSETSMMIELKGENGNELHAMCHASDGSWKDSMLDLDLFLGRKDFNAQFVWGGQAFSKHARSVRLERSHFLMAELRVAESQQWRPAIFDLDLGISNVDGALKAHDVPVVIAVHEGDAVVEALGQLAKELNDNPNLKVAKTDSEEGAIWYVHAGVDSPSPGTFFRTWSPNITLSLIHVVAEAKREIETLEIDVFKLRAGAEVGTIGGAAVNMPSYIGVDASANLIEAKASVFDLTLGLSASTGFGLKNGSLDVQIVGCGISIGKRVGISAFGAEVAIDFGRFFDSSEAVL